MKRHTYGATSQVVQHMSDTKLTITTGIRIRTRVYIATAETQTSGYKARAGTKYYTSTGPEATQHTTTHITTTQENTNNTPQHEPNDTTQHTTTRNDTTQ